MQVLVDVDELRAVRAEIAALRARVAALEARERRNPAETDRVALERILPAIAGVFGSEWIRTRDIRESSAPALRLVLEGLDAAALGAIFRRGQATAIGVHILEAGGREHGARLWRVVRIVG